ncbi:MAG: GtrA family protein [Candidatus Eremiobacteraeota bacterium]|nr:GtrA family protein [Candidatus Eremiobacteraeota bacterium]
MSVTGLRDFARRLYSDRAWPFQLARYLSIGGFVTFVDVGTFAALLRARWPLLAVITVAYSLGVTTHFSLNKYVSFRAHDRPVAHQAATYGVVALTCWATTTAIVKGAVALGAPPLLGKVIAVAFNIPIGFWGHRHLTFGRGVAAAWRGIFSRRLL